MNEIGATELTVWADRIESRGLLPELISRLVAASIKPKYLYENNFSTQEGTNSGGWDGHTNTAESHTYIPSGITGWEMGTNKGKKTKADGDFDSRTKSIDAKTKKKTHFVFVTPRRWASKNEWAEDKAKDGEWKSIKVLDAEDIIKWCQLHPAVMLWLHEKIKGESGTSRSAIDEWRYQTASLSITLPGSLLLSGREADAKELAAQLVGDAPFSALVHSQSATESKLFVLSVINTLPKQDYQAIVNKTVIADTAEAYMRLMKQPGGLIIIPDFDNPNVGLATEAGHSVIIPQGKTRTISTGAITLKQLNVDSAANALKEELGDLNKAYDMARLCKTSFVAFLRRLSKHPELRLSKWAKSRENGPELLPALLMGSWRDDNEQDKKILEELAGTSYASYIEKLQAWSIDEDPPVLKKGSTWSVVDHHDANLLITSIISLDQYKKFEETFSKVVSSEDPSHDLPVNERWLANVQGYSRPYSNELITGISSTLARIVSADEGGSIEGYATYQQSSDYIIKNILTDANSDASGKKWYSLRDVLPILAETSPDVFLEAIEKGLKQSDKVLQTMFVDDNDMFSSSPHTSLLFALETLAWNKEYLPRVAVCLAGLAEIDNEEKDSNRPFRSLHDLLSLTLPQTDISQKVRMEILELVLRKYPSVGKRLAIGLIPDSHDTYIESRRPVFRNNWEIENRRTITYKELYENISAIIDKILATIEHDYKDLAALIDILTKLPTLDFDKVLASLKDVDPSKLPDEGRMLIWGKIRDVIHQHREFPDAKWSYPSDRIDELEEVYNLFTPEDDILRVAWLFSRGGVSILNPDGHDWQKNQVLTTGQQQDAARNIYKTLGLEGIKQLSLKANDSFLVGFSLEQLDNTDEELILSYLEEADIPSQELVKGYVYSQARTRGVEIINEVLRKGDGWSTEQKTALIKSAPPSRKLWEIIELQEEEVQREYWSDLTPYGLGGDFEDYPYLSEKFLKYGRPYEALAAINYAEKNSDKITGRLMAEALNMAKNTSPLDSHVSKSMISYYVEETMKALSARSEVANDELVKLQISFFPLLQESRGESTRELRTKFSTDPELFIELIGLLYRPKSAPKKAPSDEDQKKAELAHRIIEGMDLLPGTEVDGNTNYDKLDSWTMNVLKRLKEIDRVDTGEYELGAFIYRSSMSDKSEKWPKDEVCRLLDEVESDRFMDGFVTQAFNYGGARFLTKEDVTDLAHARNADKRASEISTLYPRAARILRKVASELRSKHKRLFRDD